MRQARPTRQSPYESLSYEGIPTPSLEHENTIRPSIDNLPHNWLRISYSPTPLRSTMGR